MSRRRLARLSLIATPFVLLALGTLALVRSPWPTILGLLLKGRRIYVAHDWSTVGLGLVAAACFVAALAVSYTIRSE